MEVLLPVQKLSFPPLPLEIVFTIMAAVLEIQPAMAVELATLSRDFQPFIERLLYHSVCLNSHRQINLFVDLVTSGGRPVSFYEERVRNLCVAYRIHSQSAHAILAVCSNLRTMAFFYIMESSLQPTAPLQALLATRTIQPTRLVFQKYYFPPTHDLSLAFLQQVTHLELCADYLPPDLTLNEAIFRHLPQLTHFSYTFIASYTDAAEFVATLRVNDSLRVYILWFNQSSESVPELLQDPRLVFGLAIDPESDEVIEVEYQVLYRNILHVSVFGADWGRKQGNEPDVWELAEEIVEKQRDSLRSGR
ncbi:hypothetical protein C8J56DRAFT_477206 [Mycena floridula]|nr:hypothetical protein C8J56DRAFT_477206 [Mycena floridula]